MNIFEWMRLIRDSDSPSSAKLVAYSLATRFNRDNQCYPSLDTICADAGISKPTAIRSIRHLERCGFIAVSRKHSNASRYTMATPSKGAVEVKSVYPTGSTSFTPEVKSVYLGGKTILPHEVNSVYPKYYIEELQRSASRSASGLVTLETALEDIWETYCAYIPNRRLTEKDKGVILAAIKAYGPALCLAAIRGLMISPWHMGQNPSGKRYDRIEHALRLTKRGSSVPPIERMIERGFGRDEGCIEDSSKIRSGESCFDGAGELTEKDLMGAI